MWLRYRLQSIEKPVLLLRRSIFFGPLVTSYSGVVVDKDLVVQQLLAVVVAGIDQDRNEQ